MQNFFQDEQSRLGQAQRLIEQKSGSATFCVLPWIHLATRPNGDMRLCCTANASGAGEDHEVGLVKAEDGRPANFANHTPLESFNNLYMQSVRQTMLSGEIPASCAGCFREESQGMVSKRIWESISWHQDEGVDFADLAAQGIHSDKLQYLDLRLGHTCNIKCVMCSPHDSSRWVKDWEQLIPVLQDDGVKKQMQWNRREFNNSWHEKDTFWGELNEQIPNLKQVYFAGGEPLMIKEHKQFIEEIVRRGYQDQILLRYNSNGLLVDEDLIELWSKFKKVKFAVSTDATYERDEYIRYPTDFATVEKNLHMLDNTPDNIVVSIATAVQIFNVKHLPELIKWKVQSGFKKLNIDNVGGVQMGGGLVNFHFVHIPTFLNISILPQHDKQEVETIYTDFRDWLWNNHTTSDDFWKNNPSGWHKWQAILNHMNATDNSDQLPGFREYVNKLDAIRGLNAKSVFPELSHLL